MNEDATPTGEAPKKKISAREMMALRKAAEEGDAEAQAKLDELKSAAPAPPPPPSAPVVATPDGEPKTKMSAREMMALRKAAEEGDAEAQAKLDALKSAAPPPPSPSVPVAAPPEGEPKKKMSAREMMALRKAAGEGDAEAQAKLDAMKSAESVPLPAAPVAAEPAAPVAPRPPAAPAKPVTAAPALTQTQEAEVARFRDRFGDAVVETGIAVDTPRITVTPTAIADVCRFCVELGYNFPDTVTAVDFLEEGKIRIVYVLACIPEITRTLVLHVEVPRDGMPSVPSVSAVYPGADWDEREIYDLFGVNFIGHPDLRRIMTPDDWEGHPLRKDYTFID